MPFICVLNIFNRVIDVFIGHLYNFQPSLNIKRTAVVSTDLSAIKIYRGVSIYKVRGSQYWYCRVWDRDKKRYIVKGTGETSVIGAREVAKDYALSLLKTERAVDREFTFNHFAIKCLSKNTDYGRGRR